MLSKTHPSLAASILSVDLWDLGKVIRQLEAGGVDFLHIDIMDGHFVPEIHGSQKLVDSIYQNSQLAIDVHLMITNPLSQIPVYARAGAQSIAVHVEACRENVEEALSKIQECGCNAGLAINPNTSFENFFMLMSSKAITQLNYLIIMGVYPGFGGQKFIPQTLLKIQSFHQCMSQGKMPIIPIYIDGGVRDSNCEQMIQHGANTLIAGTFLLENQDCQKTVTKFRERLATVPILAHQANDILKKESKQKIL